MNGKIGTTSVPAIGDNAAQLAQAELAFLESSQPALVLSRKQRRII
jgi:hypothetical protein